MNSDKASSSSATHTKSCYKDISILIVDSDPICLSVASGMLRALTYEGVFCYFVLLFLHFWSYNYMFMISYKLWDFSLVFL